MLLVTRGKRNNKGYNSTAHQISQETSQQTFSSPGDGVHNKNWPTKHYWLHNTHNVFYKKKQAQHLTGQYLNLPRPAHAHRLLASCHTKTQGYRLEWQSLSRAPHRISCQPPQRGTWPPSAGSPGPPSSPRQRRICSPRPSSYWNRVIARVLFSETFPQKSHCSSLAQGSKVFPNEIESLLESCSTKTFRVLK